MKYKLVEKRNPQKPDEQKKWYANAVNEGVINIRQLSERIALQSGVSRGDILNVLESALDAIPEYLEMGYTVSLGNLASLRLTLSSKGADNQDQFDAVAMMKKPHVVFNPSKYLDKKLTDITYEKVK